MKQKIFSFLIKKVAPVLWEIIKQEARFYIEEQVKKELALNASPSKPETSTLA